MGLIDWSVFGGAGFTGIPGSPPAGGFGGPFIPGGPLVGPVPSREEFIEAAAEYFGYDPQKYLQWVGETHGKGSKEYLAALGEGHHIMAPNVPLYLVSIYRQSPSYQLKRAEKMSGKTGVPVEEILSRGKAAGFDLDRIDTFLGGLNLGPRQYLAQRVEKDPYSKQATFTGTEIKTDKVYLSKTKERVDKKWFGGLSKEEQAAIREHGVKAFIQSETMTEGEAATLPPGYDVTRKAARETLKRIVDSLPTAEIKKDALQNGLSALSLEGLSGAEVLAKYKKWGMDIPKDAEFVEGSLDPETGELEYTVPGAKPTASEFLNEPSGAKMLDCMRKVGVLDPELAAYYKYIEGNVAAAQEEFKKLTPEQKQAVLDEYGKLPQRGPLGGMMLLEIVVPGLYLARHWGELPSWQKGLFIGIELAVLIPLVRIASASRRAGLGFRAAMRETALAEVKAPVTTVLHPKQTAKAVVYPWESMLRPSKIPLSSIEIRDFIVKVPVSKLGDPKTAMAVRDKLFNLAMEGKGATVEFDLGKAALTPTALQKTIGAAAVHTTPDIRAFLQGATIQAGREGGMFLSPSLHSRFAQASAFGNIPARPMPGALLIRDPAILSRLSPSGKIYRAQVEIEKMLKAGVELPPPSQLLMTRTMAGDRITIAVIGKPLTRSEISKLKLLGAKDVVRDIFVSPYKITKAQSAKFDKLIDLGKEAQATEKAMRAAVRAGERVEATRLARELSALDRQALGFFRDIGIGARATRELRFIGLNTERPLYEQIVRDSYAADPRAFSRAYTRLPERGRAEAYGYLPTRARRDVIARTGLSVPRVAVPRVPARAPRAPARGRVPPTGVVPPKGAPPPPPPPPVKVGDRTLTPDEIKGAVAWKQGFIYKCIISPYGEDDIINTREPIPGVKYKRGPGSAYATLIKLKGPEYKIPSKIKRDMGIMDIHITTPREGKGRPKIKFRPDVQQRTTLTVGAVK